MKIRKRRLLLTLQAAFFLFACERAPTGRETPSAERGPETATKQTSTPAMRGKNPCGKNSWDWRPPPDAPLVSVVRLARSDKVVPCPPPKSALPPASVPLGLDWADAIVPEDNPITPEKAELGRVLFFDTRLSIDDSTACGTCHDPNYQYTEVGARPVGVPGKLGERRTPTIVNRAFSAAQFWDGRSAGLEDQALQPVTNPIEMAFPSHEQMIARLEELEGYGPFFTAAFGDSAITEERVAKALATFMRTINSAGSPFDRWQAGEEGAISGEAEAGWELFRGRARCIVCHSGPNFTDERFHNLGVGMDARTPDLGRYEVTRNEADKGAFKTPSLRNVAERPPYLHDGSAKDLHAVIALYVEGGRKNPWLSELIKPAPLTPRETHQLVAFLESLTGELPYIAPPNTLPGGSWDRKEK